MEPRDVHDWDSPSRLSPYERYNRDQQFRALVDSLFSLLSGAMFTPTELREALTVAAVKLEQLRDPAVFRG